MKKFLNWMLMVAKGFIMGIANVIPGVSGGTLAIILGIYDRFIEAISTIFKKFKENVLFLIPIVLGMGIGIVGGAKIVDLGLSNFPLVTILLFVGMILGGIPLLFKKVKNSMKDPINYIIFAIVFIAFILYSIFAKERIITVENIKWYDYFIFFGVGVVGAATMLMPGISGSLTLMAMGYYNLIVGQCVGNILDFSKLGFNLQVLIPFGIGCIVGLVLIAKIISFLLKKFEVKTYFAIFGFIFSSLIIIFTKNLDSYHPEILTLVMEIIVGLVLLIFGFSVSYSLSNGGVYIGIWKIKNTKKKIEENKN